MPPRPPPMTFPPPGPRPAASGAWACAAPAAPRTIREAKSALRIMVSGLLGGGAVRGEEAPGGPAIAEEDGRPRRPGPTRRPDLGHPRGGWARGPGRPAGASWRAQTTAGGQAELAGI